MSHIKYIYTYDDIISVENLLKGWKKFVHGKRNRKDVNYFATHLMDNLFELHYDLKYKIYRHQSYEAFTISDPKLRNIHKASVRDRLVHHVFYNAITSYFDRTFISDSYSCRPQKGVHRAINKFRSYEYIVSRNNTKTCWVLKCDIKKFFASIDHKVLIGILNNDISNDILLLLKEIIKSFDSGVIGKGLPLGNLTSQLLVNIYMNEFDQYIKHTLRIKYYIRYADDFVILDNDKRYLLKILPKINHFLSQHLLLQLHPNKVFIKTISSGLDFLGWIHFPNHRILRTSTKRRMFRNLKGNPKLETIASYMGMLKYGNTKKIFNRIVDMV